MQNWHLLLQDYCVVLKGTGILLCCALCLIALSDERVCAVLYGTELV